MPIAAYSVLRDYELISIYDSSIVLAATPPEVERLPDESDADLEGRQAKRDEEAVRIAKENAEAHQRAIESGNWSALLRPNDEPTRFRVRQVPGATWMRFYRLIDQMNELEARWLAFRLGVIGIVNGPVGHTVSFDESHTDPRTGEPTGLGRVLSDDVCNAIHLADRRVIPEIGLLIMRQRGGPLGK